MGVGLQTEHPTLRLHAGVRDRLPGAAGPGRQAVGGCGRHGGGLRCAPHPHNPLSHRLRGHLSRGRSQLGEEGFTVAWAGGKAMPLGQAIEYALSDEEEPPTLVPEQQPPDERTDRLTRREREVALLVARGLTNRQIASELSVSTKTANNHVARILRKLGLRSRAQIAVWVTERRSPSS